jgi:glycosyltransferase involved in cell wall biosynthesis
MRILQVAELLSPQYGGIAEGVYQQAIELGELGHQCECLSADPEPVSRLPEVGAPHHAFLPHLKQWKWSPKLRPWLKANIGRFDIAVLNGLWMGPLHETARACQAKGVPYVVMPHGMMDPYFKSTRLKSAVKSLYWRLSEGKTVRGAKGLFFTTQEEEERAREAYPLDGVRSWQVGYGIRTPDRSSAFEKEPKSTENGTLDLCFMSRIHPKKGLDLLFEALGQCPSHIKVTVCGVGDPEIEAGLREAAKSLGPRVTWTGFVKGEEKWRLLESSDAMILPSRQENFGVIVVEAMSVRVPVLISREVNIWREVEGDGAGLTCPCSVEGIRDMICRFDTLSERERDVMGRKGQESFNQRFTIQKSVRSFVGALQEAARG